MHTWQTHIPALVRILGTDAFPASLDQALRDLVPFDLSCAFAYTLETRPQLIHDGLRNVSSAAVMSNYLNGTYLLDAVYDACRRATPAGLYRLKDLAPDDFFEGDYYNSPEFHPCISMETGSLSEEIVFLTRSDGVYFAYSLLRQRQHAAFSEPEFAALRSVADTVIAFMEQQWKSLAASQNSARTLPNDNDMRLSRAMETFGQDRLTAREQAIAGMILQGHSSLSIAANLNLSEGTVKNHRKHIYAKLGIYSQSGLFKLFIDHIFG
jgi:DNA-binding NarL/FixJ family response regulator